MKTIKFVREQNTVNEYTSDCFDDCSGDFLRKDDVLALIDRIEAQIEAEEADASTWSLGGIVVGRNLIEILRASIE
jgi:hypothetical protein